MFNIEFALFLALEGQILLSINCFRDEKHCWLNGNTGGGKYVGIGFRRTGF